MQPEQTPSDFVGLRDSHQTNFSTHCLPARFVGQVRQLQSAVKRSGPWAWSTSLKQLQWTARLHFHDRRY